MKVSNVKSQLSQAFALLNCLAIGFVATGCDSDNPVDGTKDQHHADAFGLVVEYTLTMGSLFHGAPLSLRSPAHKSTT